MCQSGVGTCLGRLLTTAHYAALRGLIRVHFTAATAGLPLSTQPDVDVCSALTLPVSPGVCCQVYLCKELTDNDPALSDSPGPVYYPAAACMAGQVRPGPRWSGAPRHPAAKEPYIGK
jgi:hypothetical protein